MSLVYNFSFASPAAGETVTVTDDSGTEFASEALGSSIGEDGAITLQVSLDEGEYVGSVSGDFGTWTTRGVLDVPASIAAGGGGGVVLDGPVYLVECNAGQTALTDGSNNVVFDSFGDLTPGTGGSFILPAGAYTVDWQVNFSDPDAPWTMAFGLGGTNMVFGDGGKVIRSGTDGSSRRPSGQGTIILPADTEVSGFVRMSADADAVSPTALDITYAVLTFTQFG